MPGSPVDREVKITEETRGKGRTRQHSSSRGRRRSRPGGYDERRGRQWDTSLSGSGSSSDEKSGSSQKDASVREVSLKPSIESGHSRRGKQDRNPQFRNNIALTMGTPRIPAVLPQLQVGVFATAVARPAMLRGIKNLTPRPLRLSQ